MANPWPDAWKCGSPARERVGLTPWRTSLTVCCGAWSVGAFWSFAPFASGFHCRLWRLVMVPGHRTCLSHGMTVTAHARMRPTACLQARSRGYVHEAQTNCVTLPRHQPSLLRQRRRRQWPGAQEASARRFFISWQVQGR